MDFLKQSTGMAARRKDWRPVIPSLFTLQLSLHYSLPSTPYLQTGLLPHDSALSLCRQGAHQPVVGDSG